MENCPNCGAKLIPSNPYCPSCGFFTKEIPKEERQARQEPEEYKDELEGNGLEEDNLNVDALAKSVADQLQSGTSKQEIIKDLSDKGLNAYEAEGFINRIQVLINEERNKAGMKDLGCGFLLLIIGLAITLGTWAAAEGGGSYWVMWGAIAFGAFYILRGLYRKLTTTTNQLVWFVIGIIIIGAMVGGGFAITNLVNEAELETPSDYFIVVEDNSYWADSILSIIKVNGTVSNNHGSWSIKNVEVEVNAFDQDDKFISSTKVMVTPITIPPGGKGIYDKSLTLPISCEYVEPYITWEWIPP